MISTWFSLYACWFRKKHFCLTFSKNKLKLREVQPSGRRFQVVSELWPMPVTVLNAYLLPFARKKIWKDGVIQQSDIIRKASTNLLRILLSTQTNITSFPSTFQVKARDVSKVFLLWSQNLEKRLHAFIRHVKCYYIVSQCQRNGFTVSVTERIFLTMTKKHDISIPKYFWINQFEALFRYRDNLMHSFARYKYKIGT